MILIHGSGPGVTAYANWRLVIPDLSQEYRVIAPDISPGTYRSTPWGLLLRAVPSNTPVARVVQPVGTGNAPVCEL